MNKRLAFTLSLAMAWCLLHAVPAKPGFTPFKQSDGTTILVQTVGDEFGHCFMTVDGLALDRGSNGDFYYRTASGTTTRLAHDKADRSASEVAFIGAQREQMTLAAVTAGQSRARRVTPPRKASATQVPTMGSPRVPIILVEYSDKKMKHDKDEFQVHYNTSAKSAYQYFVDQSNGKYTPQFDLYGVYELSGTRATYGKNKSNGDDQGVATMVGEAIDVAGDDIDWSLYDNDGDGEADVCIVVYAGVGEAQASYSVPNSIWPCQWSLSGGSYYSDGTGPRTRNGVTIDRFAVFNEIGGSSDNGSVLDGIGTFCHEFSHCLGLPDWYETTYGNGYFGMGQWSLMDSGCYNDDGNTPIGYSAYEKNFMNWIDLVTPTENTHYTLPVFNNKSLEGDVAIKVTSHLNPNEYFILENRAKQGWDQYIEDEGILITHFTYVPSRWQDNTVNNYAVQLATIIPADNNLSSYNANRDLFGETNHEFSPTSTPASKLNMQANGQLASSTGGAGTLDKPITEIYLNQDKSATLWYMKAPLQGLMTPVMLEADANFVTPTSFRAEWTDETPADLVTSYTLWVREQSDIPQWEQLFDYDFSNWTDVKSYGFYFTDIATKLADYGLAGWSGEEIYSHQGYMQIGYSRNYPGTLVSPAFNLSDFEKVTLVFDAKYTRSGSSTSTLTATVLDGATTLGTASQILTTTKQTYTMVIDAQSVANATLQLTSKNNPVELTNLKVYAGDFTADANAPLLAAVEVQSTPTYRLVEGITDTFYAVNNLLENGTFDYKVRATYIDNSQSEWSEVRTVTLGNGSPAVPGDVNGDGVLDITDINAIINVILGIEPAETYEGRADINSDGSVDITDVNQAIGMLLNNSSN